MPPNDFQKAVKHRLIDLGKNNKWLCAEVAQRSGRYCDNSTLRRCLNGTTKKSPIIDAIRETLDLPEE